MRIAIQISGEFRTLHLCHEALKKNVLDVFPEAQIDFFIHTWKREQEGFGTWNFQGRGAWHNTMYIFKHETGLQLFQPKLCMIEDYEEKQELKELPRAYSMFYSIQMANLVRREYEQRTNTHYNLVMRYRTDCILNENLYECIKPYIEEKTSFLCIPLPKQPKRPDGPVENDQQGICDWFGIGTPDAMDVYCGTYETFLQLKLPLLPESMLCMQLKSRGITKQSILKRPDYDMYLVEGNGQIRGL